MSLSNPTKNKVTLYLKNGDSGCNSSKRVTFSHHCGNKTQNIALFSMFMIYSLNCFHNKDNKLAEKRCLLVTRPKIRSPFIWKMEILGAIAQKGWLLVIIAAIRHKILPFFQCYEKLRQITLLFLVGKLSL